MIANYDSFLIAVYLENIETGGKTGFKYFEDENEADNHLQTVKNDIIKHGKETVFKASKMEVDYDTHRNCVSW